MNCKWLYFLCMIVLINTSCERTVTVDKELAHWEYEHPDWQQMGYPSCGGNAQSPINILTNQTLVNENMPELVFDYTPFQMKIVDNGHTIQVNPSTEDNALYFNGVKYTFAQLHFHHKSEHQIDGDHKALELHCVHRDENSNLLVLTFMIQEGMPNEFLEQIFQNIPEEKRVEMTTEIFLDLNEILPDNRAYYTYYGSLTTPPCTATVQFVVLKEPMIAGSDQISRFATFYFANYRMIQPLNNRLVLEKPN